MTAHIFLLLVSWSSQQKCCKTLAIKLLPSDVCKQALPLKCSPKRRRNIGSSQLELVVPGTFLLTKNCFLFLCPLTACFKDVLEARKNMLIQMFQLNWHHKAETWLVVPAGVSWLVERCGYKYEFAFLAACRLSHRAGSSTPSYWPPRHAIGCFYSNSCKMPAALAENSQVICEVWANNLEEEMRKIREIVLSYRYIAMVRIWCFLMTI